MTDRLCETLERACQDRPEIIAAAAKRMEEAIRENDETLAQRWFCHMQSLLKAFGERV